MISRVWHGWTIPENTDTYEGLLRSEILPGIAAKNIPGYRGLQAMTLLVGSERAREIMVGQTHYTWIYDQVLNNLSVRKVNDRHGFVLN